jgi:hypothetical protein
MVREAMVREAMVREAMVREAGRPPICSAAVDRLGQRAVIGIADVADPRCDAKVRLAFAMARAGWRQRIDFHLDRGSRCANADSHVPRKPDGMRGLTSRKGERRVEYRWGLSAPLRVYAPAFATRVGRQTPFDRAGDPPSGQLRNRSQPFKEPPCPRRPLPPAALGSPAEALE